MKKFEKITKSKLEKLLNDSSKKMLLKEILGGANGCDMKKGIAYADAVYVNKPYVNAPAG